MTQFALGVLAGVLLTVPLALLLTLRTVRKVRRLSRRARTAERLAELGTLTSGLAHEIKNPLSTVGLNVQLLTEDLGDLERHLEAMEDEETIQGIGRLRRRLDSLMRETHRLRDILEDFLKFAGRIKLNIQPTDIGKLIDELTDFFEPQAQAARVQLRTQLAANPTLEADGDLLKQALLNLLINAVQAMERARGNARSAHGGADELIIRTELDDDHLDIHVIDTGPGIAPELAEKIFRPYVSTRPGGSGLGLAVARRIIEEHGGQITLHSEIGRGSDFCIELPLNRA